MLAEVCCLSARFEEEEEEKKKDVLNPKSDVRQNIDLAERFFARARGQVEEAAAVAASISSSMTSSSESNRGNDNNAVSDNRSSLTSSGSKLGIIGRTRGRSRSEDATGVEQQEIRFIFCLCFCVFVLNTRRRLRSVSHKDLRNNTPLKRAVEAVASSVTLEIDASNQKVPVMIIKAQEMK